MISLLLRYRQFGLGPVVSASAKSGKAAKKQQREFRDYQRSKLYRWEREHVFIHDSRIISLSACRILVEEAYRWWEQPSPDDGSWQPPVVTDGRGRRHACGSREIIKLPRWARTRPIVLHECAHGMSDDKHGPKFLRGYVELLVTFASLERDGLNRSIAKVRLDMAPRFSSGK